MSNDKIDFRLSTDQPYYFDWLQRTVTVQFHGIDPITEVRLYGFAEPDVDEDPRGPLGVHTIAHLDPKDYDMEGERIVFSWATLNNDQHTYNLALEYARRRWRAANTAPATLAEDR